MAQVSINGVTFTGRSIQVNGDEVVVDGKVVQVGEIKNRRLEVRVLEGVLESLVSEHDIRAENVTIKGDVKAGGDVACHDVGGNVTADGDVACNNVNGNVKADGDVTAGRVQGSVRADGDVIHG